MVISSTVFRKECHISPRGDFDECVPYPDQTGGTAVTTVISVDTAGSTRLFLLGLSGYYSMVFRKEFHITCS